MRRLITVALFLVAAAVLARADFGDGSAGRTPARVTRIVDGDTVHIAGLGSSRLIGVDTPEVFGTPECYGARATRTLTRMLRGAGDRITYTYGAERQDRYGRDLVYLWLPDGTFVNEQLLLRGAAEVLTIAPNDRYERRFERAEAKARSRMVGRWRVCGG